MNSGSTNGLILLLFLAEQDGGPSVRIYLQVCMRWTPPAAVLRYVVFPIAGHCIPVSPVAGSWIYEPPRPQPLCSC